MWGSLEIRSYYWQFLSRLTILNYQKRLKDLPNLNPFHGLLVCCCSLTYHRPKQSFCLSKSWLAIVQEPHVTQERSSETIMTNPLLLLVLSCFFSEPFSIFCPIFLFKFPQCLIWNKVSWSGFIKWHMGLVSKFCFVLFWKRVIVRVNLLPGTLQDTYYIVGVSFYDHDNLEKNVMSMKKLRFREIWLV